jgi:WS/DGAT/MGAT family acyltransferase
MRRIRAHARERRMQQLQGLDATFIFLESAAMPLHTGTLQLYARPPGARGRFLPLLREHVKARLPELPMLCRRLWWMPLNLANPAWVEARPDLRVHIVAAKLPRGAGMAALETEVARLHATLLDRERPLWQIHVFEELAPDADGQRRVAVFLRLHHAGFDAQATAALANALLDLSPALRQPGARRTRRAAPFEPGMTEALRVVLGGQASKAAAIIRDMPATLGGLRHVAGRALTQAGLLVGAKGRAGLPLAPATPFNVTLGRERRFVTASLSQPEVQELARLHGATLQEMVLLLCASTLRRHLARRRRLPRRSNPPAVPWPLPDGGEEPAGRLSSMRLVGLGTHLADPVRRLSYIRAAVAAPPAGKGLPGVALPADFPSLGLPWLIEAASSLYGRARVAERMPQVANLVIGLVPGPSVPLYLAGARLLASYPASVLVHGLALNITVRLQAGALDFGIVADAQAVPEPQEFAQALAAAWDDLLAMPRPAGRQRDAGAGALVGRASRAVSEAVQGAVKGAVAPTEAVAGALGGVITAAIGRVTRSVVRSALDGALGAAVPGAGAADPAQKEARRPGRPATARPRR